MESLVLKELKQKAKKQEQEEIAKKHSRFNFGKKGNAILTSTSNSKAHSFNKFDRERLALHNTNVDKMVEEFNKGIVSKNKSGKKLSKTARRYNQRVQSKIENSKIRETINMLSQLFTVHDISKRILDAK